MNNYVTIVGAGLAGCEAAWQLVRRGVPVRLIEMKPVKFSPAHKSEGFAELVCSNSLKAEQLSNASGLLKAEMRALDGLVLSAAEACRVPAGGALAVDRDLFSARITDTLKNHPLVTFESRVVDEIPEAPAIIATGPLTDPAHTDANARLCRQFITANSKAFRQAEQRYGVPSSIAASLLFVETRLGKVLGDTSENAFYTLASMAVSRTPESISDWLPQLRDHERHMDWIAETMPKRADWAYKETRALVEHMLRDRVPPEHLPGSIYGAVGLCQFMPSNIATYGADGDGDGRVDLFTVPDAVASLSHYLARHGWKAGLSRERQHALLMRYNHSTVYANTIMALADRVAALK